jgi:hypothetical protein
MMHRVRTFGARVVVAVLLLAGACSGEEGAWSCSDASADWSLPTESQTDWVSYGDQLSVVEVLAEEKRWRVPDPGAPPDDWLGRSVEIRVTETAWRRAGAPSAPERFSMITDPGWSLKHGLRPITFGEGPRLEIGRRYAMVLVRYDEGEWAAYPRATLPLEPDGRIGSSCSQRPVRKGLTGLTVGEVARRLTETPPDPRAVAHASLPPKARFQAVY